MKDPIEILKTAVSYDPDTGLFYWRESRRGHRKAGDLAGSLTRHGYWKIKINQRAYFAHRLAWAFCFDEWPAQEIDHINGDPLDNRILNLRQASRQENCQNVKGRGVRFEADRGKWLARICVNGKQQNLGRFATEAEAEQAFAEAKRRLRGSFACA